MLLDLAASIGGYLQLRDIIGPLLGGLLGYMGARATARATERTAEIKRSDALEAGREQRRAASADDLSNRFQILMDGYETRINDLTSEVQNLRLEVIRLRQQLERGTAADAS